MGAPRRLEGRTAIVTGAARGIGYATAERLAAEGARVLLAGLDAGVEAAAERLGQPWVVADVSGKAGVETLFAEADAVLGSLDILVNNAGVMSRAAPLVDLDEAEF